MALIRELNCATQLSDNASRYQTGLISESTYSTREHGRKKPRQFAEAPIHNSSIAFIPLLQEQVSYPMVLR